MNRHRVDNGTYIRVINFPVPEGAGVRGESMWVLLRDGDEDNGTGWLSNTPALCTDVEHGSLVEFGGGSSSWLPKFIKVLEKSTERFKN